MSESIVYRFPVLRPLSVVELMDQIIQEDPKTMIAISPDGDGFTVWYTGGLQDAQVLMMLERVKLQLVTGELSVEPDKQEPEE